jgi:hypothetical protein
MDSVEYVIAAVTVAILVVIGVWVTQGAQANEACLAAGWPRATLDYRLNAYCIKRVDQTDVVLPLEKVQR